MPFIYDAAFDAAIALIDANATALSLCTQEPTTYTQAKTTYALGVTSPIDPAPASNGAVSGRRSVIPATTVLCATAGTATHWALHNNTNTLVATGPLVSSIAMSVGVNYTVDSFSVGILDATAV